MRKELRLYHGPDLALPINSHMCLFYWSICRSHVLTLNSSFSSSLCILFSHLSSEWTAQLVMSLLVVTHTLFLPFFSQPYLFLFRSSCAEVSQTQIERQAAFRFTKQPSIGHILVELSPSLRCLNEPLMPCDWAFLLP